MKVLAIVAMGSAAVLAGCGKAGEDFQNCILSKVTSNTNQNTIKVIQQACAQKYQTQLPQEAVDKLKGRAGQSLIGFRINVNNRNDNWTVTEIEFYVTKGASQDRTPYRQNVYILPLQKDGFWPNITNEPKEQDDFNWGIIKAWGVPSK
jgi:hypothetical protein